MRKASVIGLGGLGVMFGWEMQKALGNNFWVTVDKNRKARYATDDLTCNQEKCVFNYKTPEECDGPADLLIFGTKISGLADAIETARPFVGENTTVISVLNGISSEEILSDAYGAEKVLYATAQGMDTTRHGSSVEYHRMGNIIFGELDGRDTPRTKEVARFLKENGVDGRPSTDARRIVWNKLMLNVGLNQCVTAYEGTYRTVQTPGEPRDVMFAAMREVQAIAKHHNIHLTEEDIRQWDALVGSLHPDAYPSMRQDALAKRKTELELFGETVVRHGKKFNTPTPINDYLVKRIKEVENAY